MIYKFDIYEFICYLVYRKKQSKISGKSKKKLEENMVNAKHIKSQINKNQCY